MMQRLAMALALFPDPDMLVLVSRDNRKVCFLFGMQLRKGLLRSSNNPNKR